MRTSAAGRTAVDWTVIGLVAGAILYNLIRLGRRLHAADGMRAVWHLQRTVLLWVVGLLNTALIRPVDVGTWKHLAGWAFVVAAVFDTVALLRKERRSCVRANGSP